MINLRGIGPKALVAGLTGVLATAGIGVAVAQVETPVIPTDTSILDVDEVTDHGGDLLDSPETTLPDTGVEDLDDVVDDVEDTADDTVDDVGEDINDELDDAVDDGDGDEAEDDDGTGNGADDDASDDAGESADRFGAQVSADARGESDGQQGVDGRQISADAHARNDARRAARDNGDDDVEVDDDTDGVESAG